MKKLKRHLNWKKIGIFGGSLIFIFVAKGQFFSAPPVEKTPEKPMKEVETILYGKFSDESTREVLATIESSADSTINARVSGRIGKIPGKIGDLVQKGQLLAQYDLSNDLSQIQYENALNTLLTTKASTQNAITSAEIALQNAKLSLNQVNVTQNQTASESVTSIKNQYAVSKANFESAKDYADSILGASDKYKSEMTGDILEIGRNDSIKKQQTKVQMQQLNNEYTAFKNDQTIYVNAGTEFEIKAENLISFLRELHTILKNISDLIRNTVTSRSFSQTTKTSFETQASTYMGQINADLLTLNSLLESIKTRGEYEKAELLAAQNAVKNAEAALLSAKANAQAQIATAESGVRISKKSQKDLFIQSPITGKISEILIDQGSDVTPGTPLFKIVSTEITPEARAYLTLQELEDIQNAEESITVTLSDGTILAAESFSASSKINPESQKTEVRFFFSEEEISGKNISVGSFAKINLPFPQKTTLIPLSAISFEPNGAEVFIVNDENTIERRTVIPGKIIGNTIEISGLEEDTKIVQYRSRVHAGETVLLRKK